MIKNYVKIALRNLNRFKGYAGINLLGLALGLTCGILIMLFVIDELSFDKFNKNYDRIYRVTSSWNETNGWAIGEKIRQYPEVEALIYAKNSSFQVVHDNKRFTEKIYYAGADFFKIFTYEFIAGTPSEALIQPFNIIVTEKIANKYFGKTDVLGENLLLGDSIAFQISGVIKDVPRQSHIQFDILISFETYPKLNTDFTYSGGWGNLNVRNYLLLKEGVDAKEFEAKISNLYMDNVGDFLKQMGMELYVVLEPLSEVYLESKAGNGWGPKGSMDQVYLVSAIALFVIMLACINFVNLTTARSAYRAKEVGLRKVVGSSRRALLLQFLAESFVITFLAFLMVAVLIDLIMPSFNELIGRTYQFEDLFQPQVIIGVIALILLITLLSGYYPAWVLSGFKPAETLKGKLTTGEKGARLRKSLVIFQFLISSILVVGTLVALDQLQYMRDQDPGFARDQVVVLDASRVNVDSIQYQTFKNQLKNFASVSHVSFTNSLPGKFGWRGQWCTPEGFPEGESISVEYTAVDEDFLEVLGLQLIAGRNYDVSRASDIKYGLILNETAVQEMGWKTPEAAIGKMITSPSGYPAGEVIGVVKDYHQESLQHRIRPLVMDYEPRFGSYYAVNFVTGNTTHLMEQLKSTWKTAFPDYEFTYFFLNDEYDQQYRSEERLVNVLMVFAIVTVIIAVVGLFGLVSFIVVSKTKEIGIRKILGAGILDVTKLISWQFLKLVIIANLIIIPIAWYFGDRWLENFAYRMDINPAIFLVTTIISVGIALFTVSYQTIKAALQNPVDSLRTE